MTQDYGFYMQLKTREIERQPLMAAEVEYLRQFEREHPPVHVATSIPEQYFRALDTLHRASQYLATQFSVRLTYTEARSHFDARSILARASAEVLKEAERAVLD